MAYHPLLLNGPTADVVITVLLTLCAIIAFVACMERYFLTRMNWPETIGWGVAPIALIWADRMLNWAGLGLFAMLVAIQIAKRVKRGHPQQSAAA
jgi:TRAP-type uncharacterized transport system fused permease subunit